MESNQVLLCYFFILLLDYILDLTGGFLTKTAVSV